MDRGVAAILKVGGGQLSGEVTLKGKLIMYIMYKISKFMFI